MTTIDLTFDANKKGFAGTVDGRQGDTDIVIRAYIYDDGQPFNFADRYLEFTMIRPDGGLVHLVKELVHIGNTNIWELTLPPEATCSDGVVKLAYFVVKSSVDPRYRQSMGTFTINLDKSATHSVCLSPYSDQLDSLIEAYEVLNTALEKTVKTQVDRMDTIYNTFNDAMNSLMRGKLDPLYSAEIKAVMTDDDNYMREAEFVEWVTSDD